MRGGAVCFHCAAGISRSSTMVISYLMAAHSMSLLEAFALCYHHRRVIWPNRSFMQQLIAYERVLQVSIHAKIMAFIHARFRSNLDALAAKQLVL